MATPGGANLRVRISADLEDIKKGLGLLRGELAKVKAEGQRAAPDASAWESGIGRIRSSLGNLAGAYVGIQGISRGISALFDAVERADQLDEMSQSAGVSVESLSRLAFAAQFSGVEITGLSRGLRKLADDATQNQGLLGALGIEIADAAGNARSADALLLDLADVFAALPDGAEKTALAMKLFGERVGPQLVPLLNEGQQGLIDLGIEAERSGAVMSTAAAQGASEFSDNLDRLKSQATGLANETAKRLIPAFSGYVEAASGAGQQANVAAEGGEFLAKAIKGIAAPVILVKNLLEGLINVLLFVGDTSVQVAGLIGSTLTRSVGGLQRVLLSIATGKSLPRAVFDEVGAGVRGMGADATKALDGIRNGFSAMKDGVAEAGRDIAAINQLFEESAAQAEVGTRKTGEAAAAAAPDTAKLLGNVRAILGEGDKGGSGGSKTSKTETKIKQLADSTVLLQDAVKRAQEALDQQFEDGAITAAQYYGQRLALQQQLIDLQIAQLQSELALTTELDRRRNIEEQITLLQRDRAQAGTDAARAQRKREAELNAERLTGLRNRASELTGGLSAGEQSISAQVAAGSLGYLEGERRLREIRAESLDQLRALRQEQAAYIASLAPGDPNLAAAREGLLGIDTAIANVHASMQILRQDTMDVGVGALSNFFSSLRDGATSAGDAFRALVADFARGIYDMLAQATAKRLVGAIAGLFGGGAGEQDVQQGAVALSGAAVATTIAGGAISAGATQLSVSAAQLTIAARALAFANAARGGSTFGLAHSGGVAGALRMSRSGIDPMVFGAAPRYHGGGIAGLESDEIPAILQRGETIRTRQQEAALQARMSAGQAATPVVRNVIVFDEAELANALAGSAGEKVVINHVRRNRGGVNG